MKTFLAYLDDTEQRRFLSEFFEKKENCRILFADNADDASEKLKTTSPDAFLVSSPDCLEATAEQAAGFPVIALIASDATRGIRSVVRSGVEQYLTKPFYEEDLEYKLTILSRKRDYLKDLYRERKDIESLTDLTHILSSTLDPKELLYLIVKKLSELIPVTRCSILSVPGQQETTVDVVSTFEDPELTQLKLELKKYPEIMEAVATRQPIIIKDAEHHPLMEGVREIIRRLGIKSIVVIPILFRSEVIGTLFLRTSTREYSFSDREIRLCRTIASAAANALDNAYLFQEVQIERAELERLSITDYLTGVYNIRYLYHRVEKEFSTALRYKTPLSCLMLDIDHFKRINDSYGHRTGDMVLREFAGLVSDHSRNTDVLARYGGEEFIMLMPQTGLDGAMVEAQRIRDLIRTHRFRGVEPSTVITISSGLACFPFRDIENTDDLITAADDALIRAKEAGRDRIVAHR